MLSTLPSLEPIAVVEGTHHEAPLQDVAILLRLLDQALLSPLRVLLIDPADHESHVAVVVVQPALAAPNIADDFPLVKIGRRRSNQNQDGGRVDRWN